MINVLRKRDIKGYYVNLVKKIILNKMLFYVENVINYGKLY